MSDISTGEVLNMLNDNSTDEIIIYYISIIGRHNKSPDTYQIFKRFKDIHRFIEFLSHPPFGNFSLYLESKDSYHALKLRDFDESSVIFQRIIHIPDNVYNKLKFDTTINNLKYSPLYGKTIVKAFELK